MAGKIDIVRHLGENAIVLPELLAAALAANDRAKLRLTALQEAVVHARNPERRARSLAAEQRAAGAGALDFDRLIAEARSAGAGRVHAPGASALIDGLFADLDAMLAPLRAADGSSAAPFADRLAALRARDGATAPAEGDDADIVGEALVARLGSAARGGDDSVHLLVMDLHKGLNRLSAELAVEVIDGAQVLHLAEGDRPLVEAFMRGLHHTSGLAFGHPGLGTTASRAGERLIIQNDIGTTDAHVIIVAVAGLTATLTYTDVHRRRARFFKGLFARWSMHWSGMAERSVAGLADDGAFVLVTGTYEAETPDDLAAFLAFAASRLVFLIDWNKARKALQTFVDKDAAVQLLEDAADGDYGHRAFLELGGADLIFDAVRRTADGRIPYGARLDRALGPQPAADFLGRTLRLASRGLAEGRSVRLLKDEVRAELGQCIGSVETMVLTQVLRQLGLCRMLAALVDESVSREPPPDPGARARFGERAKALEERADEIVLAARDASRGPLARGERFMPLVNAAEDAVDAMEEAAFLISITPSPVQGAQPALRELTGIAVACVSDLVRAVAAGLSVPAGQRGDLTDALERIDAVLQHERQADAAQRRTVGALITAPAEANALVCALEVTRAVETATDHLARAALALKACVLEETAP